MKLYHLLNEKVIIARLATDSGIKLHFTTVTSAMGHLQPEGNSKNQIDEGVYGKSFRLYMDSSVDIQEGDQLKDTNGEIYRVKPDGVTRRAFGSIDYSIVSIEKTKQ